MCNAIAYAHSRGVLHRDLKPGNILLGQYGETLVVDWGLAKPLEKMAAPDAAEGPLTPSAASGSAATAMGRVVGTPAYMSPEQAAGRLDQLGPASDVYSLGATLYCVLTGKAPFEERELGPLLQKVRRGEFPPPRELNAAIPAALEAICLKAMARHPPDRFASAQLLGEEIERWLLGREQAKTRALEQVNMLGHAKPQAAALLLADLQSCREDVEPRLQELWDRIDITESHRLRIGLALLPGASESLRDRLVDLMLCSEDPQEVVLARDALTPHGERVRAGLWKRLDLLGASPDEQFRALVALAAFDPASPNWPGAARKAVDRMLQANLLHIGVWKQALESVRAVLLEPLAEEFRGAREAERRRLAAAVLADFAGDLPEVLAGLVTDADERQYAVLRVPLRKYRDRAVAFLRQELQKAMPAEEEVALRDALAGCQARAAVALLQLGEVEPVWPLLRHTPAPGLRTYLLHLLGQWGTDAGVVIERLETETDVSIRRALILSLGEFADEQLPAERRQPLAARLLDWYRDDPDPGIHSAVDWLLRHGRQGKTPRMLNWERAEGLDQIDRLLAGRPPGKNGWYITEEGLTLAVVRNPEVFLMGSPAYEPEREPESEAAHYKWIPRSFAIGTKEVTVAQFQRFLNANPTVRERYSYSKRLSPDDHGPALSVTWFEAVQYCNWLSSEEGMPEEQWSYPSVEKIGVGMTLPRDYLQRTGYRLPTEAEWEYACRAGARTSRFYGSSLAMLKEYAWYMNSSNDERTWPVGQLKPNDLGLFDIYGNAAEWCQDLRLPYRPAPEGQVSKDVEYASVTVTEDIRVVRGCGFGFIASMARSASRDWERPSKRQAQVGLRVARTCD